MTLIKIIKIGIILFLFICCADAYAQSESKDSTLDNNLETNQADSIISIHSKADEFDSSFVVEEILSNNRVNIYNDRNFERDKSLTSINWPMIVSWVLIILGVMIAYFHIDHMSRPTLTILVMQEDPSNGKVQPTIENTSKIDAEGTVILRLLIDGNSYHCDKDGAGSYSGNRIWYFPATNKEMRGSINLKQRIDEIIKEYKISDPKKIYLESCMHYRR